MKLSDAIVKGRALVPERCYGMLYRQGYSGNLQVCDMGAAWIGLTGTIINPDEPFYYGDHPECDAKVTFPIKTVNFQTDDWWNAPTTAFSAVAELQDSYGWTTDQIVEWLRSIGL